MHEPKLSDYGLDDAAVAGVREQVARLDTLKTVGGWALFLLAYAIVVAALWPLFGVLSCLGVIPGALLGGFFVWCGASLTRTYFENRVSAIPGYDSLRRFEAASLDYERYCALAEMAERRELARRELERKRRSWEYWTNLSPGHFEHEVAELFQKQGFGARVTPGSGDGGIDIILTRDRSTTLVQCKRYKDKVGPAPIRELYGVMVACGVKRGVVVCPSGFTEGAWKFAKRSNIQLIGLKRLIELNDTELGGVDG